jgi:NADPH:quinone reductase-like Zn-dependent oxidoreductase
VSFAEATVISRHAPTAYNLLVNMARLQAGEWVLIMGASGNLGTFGVQIAKSRGATVIAAAGSAERVQVGLDLGADFGVDYRARDLTEDVMRITDGRGVDVVYDNIADPETCPKAIAALAKHGRLVTAGAHGGPVVPVDFYTLYHNKLTLMGNPENRTEDLEPCLREAAAGRLRVRIDRILPLSRVQEAHRLIESEPGIGKIILDPTLG